MIDNVGDYLYLNNGNFKFDDDPHNFNMKWLIMLGFMDLRRPGVSRRSIVGLWSIIGVTVVSVKKCVHRFVQYKEIYNML